VDAEEKLIRELLFESYREINPDLTHFGSHLITRLAAGMYRRGARIYIGATRAPKEHIIHHSTGPTKKIVWTCKTWREVLGFKQPDIIGQPITKFIAPESYGMFTDFIWPALRDRGEKVESVIVGLLNSSGQVVRGVMRAEVLRDPSGAFLRTFTKIRVTLAVLFGLACGVPTSAGRSSLAPATVDHGLPMASSRLRPGHHYGYPSGVSKSLKRGARPHTLRPGSPRRFYV
jgi:hypothetical protein